MYNFSVTSSAALTQTSASLNNKVTSVDEKLTVTSASLDTKVTATSTKLDLTSASLDTNLRATSAKLDATSASLDSKINNTLGPDSDVTFNSLTTTADVVVGGNLQVLGTKTELNVQELRTTDHLITIASGALALENIDNAGIEFGSTDVSIKYSTDSDGIVFTRPVIGDLDGTAGTANRLTTARTITLAGDLSGNVSFDGSSNVTLTAAVSDDSHAHVIANVDGLQTALNSKVDDSQVLTDVPADAVFTDTTYTVRDGGLTQKNFTTALKGKLDGIEAGATGDMTPSEIADAYESNADRNTYTDAERAKLDGIEANATADQTGAEIKTAYEGNADTNAYTDLERTKLAGIAANATNTLAPAVYSDGDSPLLATGITAGEVRSLIGAGTSNFNGAYGSLSGIPNTFTPSAHTHEIEEVTGLQDALDGKVDDGQVLTNVPADAVFTDTVYSVGDGGLTQKNFTTTLKTKLDGIAASATNTAAPAISTNGASPSLASGITGAEIRSLIGAGTSTFSGAYSSLSGIPSTFAPSAHTHAIAEIEELEGVLDAKLESSALASYATQTYVTTQITNLVDSAPGTLNTLNELAAALGDDPNFATSVTTQIGAKLDASTSPVLTLAGDVTGAVTFLSMSDATLTVTVNDDSHNHTIANVDGLQTALNGKASSGDVSTVNTRIDDEVLPLFGDYVETTSYTAADVLAKLLTVDGAGSNLDADLLDGQSGQYYLEYENLNGAPTIPAAPNNGTITIATGTGLTGGAAFTTNQSAAETITISHADTSTLSGAYGGNNNGVVIEDITVDANGHVTAVGTRDLDTRFAALSHTHEIEEVTGLQDALDAKQAAGTYNTIIGTDTDINTSGATIIDNINVTDGVITSMGTRALTPSDIGAQAAGNYSTATNATNNGDGVSLGGHFIANSSGLVSSGVASLDAQGVAIFTLSQGDASLALDTDNNRVTLTTGGAEGALLDVEGNWHARGEVIAFSGEFSDGKLKTNVATLSNATEKVNALRGVSFDWSATSRAGQSDIGLIAQEVLEVVPEVVRERETPLLEGHETALAVDYSKLVALLVESNKELTARIEELEKKLG